MVTRSSSSSAAIGPGSRWCSGGRALYRWVATVQPASMPAMACSYVASLWPRAAMTPSETAARIVSRPPGSSGAMVSIRTCPRPALSRPANSPAEGWRSSVGSCAPQRDRAMYGPSKWTPASSPSSHSSARAEVARARSASDAVTRLAMIVVVPCAAWKAATRRASSWSPEGKEPPAPPWVWMSTKPGTTYRPARLCPSRGAWPWPMWVTRPSSMVIQPSCTPSGVTTRASASVMLMRTGSQIG